MDDETRAELDAIINLARSIPEPPGDLSPDEQVAWLIEYLVTTAEFRRSMPPRLLRYIDEHPLTPEGQLQAVEAYAAAAGYKMLEEPQELPSVVVLPRPGSAGEGADRILDKANWFKSQGVEVRWLPPEWSPGSGARARFIE